MSNRIICLVRVFFIGPSYPPSCAPPRDSRCGGLRSLLSGLVPAIICTLWCRPWRGISYRCVCVEFLPGNNYPDSHHSQGVWNLPHKFHLYLIIKEFETGESLFKFSGLVKSAAKAVTGSYKNDKSCYICIIGQKRFLVEYTNMWLRL